MLVPILRSGIALLPAFLKQLPHANVGMLGLARDKQTHLPKIYYKNIPRSDAGTTVIVLDPVLATGGTAQAAIELLLEEGLTQENILLAGLICAPEGIAPLQEKYPGVRTHFLAVGEGLDEHKYIIPGIGDFGDRFFGTQ
jgi:uracil phosphoribosyltransferase